MSFSLKHVSYSYPNDKNDPHKTDVYIENLEIERSGITAIIGPSGSGKTTLLSILAGFIKPDIESGGYLRFKGRDFRNSGHDPGQIAFVFQTSLLLGSATGLTNILQGYVASGHSRKGSISDVAIVQTLEKLGLADERKQLAASRASRLSGGEAQRFAIARALLTGSDVIICDEPTSSLDAANATRALNALRAWSLKNEKPIIWVTHNLEQAARYADHFILVSKGRTRAGAELGFVFPPLPVVGEDQDIVQERLKLLRECAACPSDDVKQAKFDGARLEAPVRIRRWRYVRWISNALSTDISTRRDSSTVSPAKLTPVAQQKLFRAMYSGNFKIANILERTVGRFTNYSRKSLSIVLGVFLLQIYAALFFGGMATHYTETRLEDPAVARIVFEHVVGGRNFEGDSTPSDLNPSVTLPLMVDELSRAITTTHASADTGRVKIFGRRSISQSQLRFASDEPGCNVWLPVETVALDIDDPLVQQARLVPERSEYAGPHMVGEVSRFSAQVKEKLGAISTQVNGALDFKLVKLLRDKCKLGPEQPLVAEWAAGTAGTLNPITLNIIASVDSPPPVYPSSLELLVFEHDYWKALDLQGGAAPEPFRIATAYFPIDAFDIASRFFADRGYRIRDDSSAAVKTLRQISQIAFVAPLGLIGINVVACLVVIILVVGSIAELNKRVLAIFAAHGFAFFDLLAVMLVHLLLAAVIAVGLGGIVVGALWCLALSALPNVDLAIVHIRDISAVRAIGILLAVFGLSVTLAAWKWWKRIRLNLKQYLQD